MPPNLADKSARSIKSALVVLTFCLLISECHAGRRIEIMNLTGDSEGSLPYSVALTASEQDVTLDLSQLRGRLVFTNPLPAITGSMRLVGPGPSLLSLDCEYQTRHFHVGESGRLQLESLQLMRGSPADPNSGGSTLNRGELVVSNCVFARNSLRGGFGGAIFSQGKLQVQNTHFVSNSACGGEPNRTGLILQAPGGIPSMTVYGGYGAAMGGAIFINGGNAEFERVDFDSNTASGGGSSSPGCTGRVFYNNPAPGSGGGPDPGAPDREAGFGSGGGVGSPAPGFGGGSGSSLTKYVHHEVPGYIDLGLGASSGFGGAIFIKAGSVALRSSRFVGNIARAGRGHYPNGEGYLPSSKSAFGGAVYVFDGEVGITDCLLLKNTAEGQGRAYAAGSAYGGGVFVYGGRVRLQACSLVENLLLQTEGASLGSALVVGGGEVLATNCTISTNRISGATGALVGMFDSGKLAGTADGAAVSITNGTLRLDHCTLVNNRGKWGDVNVGGATSCREHLVSIIEQKGPGALLQTGGRLLLRASLVSGNGVQAGSCLEGGPIPASPPFTLQDGAGRIESLGYNLIQITNGLVGVDLEKDLYAVEPSLTALTSGAAGLPYHALKAGSPGINCVPLAGLPARDQLGNSRPQGPYGEIGAVERAGDASLPRPIRQAELKDLELGPGETGGILANLWSLEGTYQWFHDGVPIPGAVGRRLEIPAFSRESMGAYSVRATTSSGSADAGPVAVRFKPAPVEIAWVRFMNGSFDSLRVTGRDQRPSGLMRGSSRILGVESVPWPTNSTARYLRQFSPNGELIASYEVPGTESGTGMLLGGPNEEYLIMTQTQNGVAGFRSYRWAPNFGLAGLVSELSRDGSTLAERLTGPNSDSLLLYRQTFGGLRSLVVFNPDLSRTSDPILTDGRLVARVDTNRWVVLENAYQTDTYFVRCVDQFASNLWSFLLKGVPATYINSYPLPVLAAESGRGLSLLVRAGDFPIELSSGTGQVVLLGGQDASGQIPTHIMLFLDSAGKLQGHMLLFTGGLVATAMSSDAEGNLYVVFKGAGYNVTQQSDLFDDSSHAIGDYSICVAKFSSTGERRWSMIRTADSTFLCDQVTPDGLGGCYLTGAIQNRPASYPVTEFGRTLPHSVAGSTQGFSFLARVGPEVSLLASPRPGGETLRISIWGQDRACYLLESSDNLQAWRALTTVSAPDSVAEFTMPAPHDSPHLFLRAHQLTTCPKLPIRGQ